ncbi:hypothetical protein TRIATDRAFT_89220 [Trichoderma atroviride IMI 206040]|uniref:Uncharacterized protein n=1 Tax=Hypocrea atroviridis (strain ATCC 20476 / IMI 206040) TaxID=452589 RepID=G9PAM6_HYPAI|nr:uncharacterized protein TRIATDRAFT_89220 [Trichoderma atroviride IMI 206040]EHK40059.1 hypothetical protein TRIATDRAFT_89220 [Trichoderma atroviride IMI 206040]
MAAKTAKTLSSGPLRVPYMPMTVHAIPCPPPILPDDFDGCRIPGGVDLWSKGGFYSPGECFSGYRAMCTQTSAVSSGWPIQDGETVVRCVPDDYTCNDVTKDQKYAVTNYDGTMLSAPAFEIRWRSVDLVVRTTERNPPGLPTRESTIASHIPTSTAFHFTMTNVLITTPTPPIPPTPPTTPTTPTTPTSPHSVSPATEQNASNNASSPLSPQPKPILNSGTIAGITVGSCLGLLAVASAIIFFLVRRRRRQQGPRRLTDDTWTQQETYKEPADLAVTRYPAELENKPMELRELPVETHSPSADASPAPRACHISVNTIPVEVAADPVQNISEAIRQGD